MTAKKLISVKNLSRHFSEHIAVDNISFELETGDILGFLGPNGAGKSTTMQMLSGNLAPTTGEISINGIDLFEYPKQAKSALGYLPETPPLYKDMTVDEFLFYCAKLHRIKKSDIKNRLLTTLQRCGLLEVRKRLIGNLSKGYQQRIGIAQAIFHSPPVIILDEPTVGLDPIQILEIRALIKELGKNHGIILCSHILPEVQAVCNRVQIINHGVLAFESSMDALQQQNIDWFEASFKHTPDLSSITALDNIHHAEKIGLHDYLIQSSLQDEQLCEKLVQQSWGLTRFNRHQQSLEQIFTELTLAEEEHA